MLYCRQKETAWAGKEIRPLMAKNASERGDRLAALAEARDAGGMKVSYWPGCLHAPTSGCRIQPMLASSGDRLYQRAATICPHDSPCKGPGEIGLHRDRLAGWIAGPLPRPMSTGLRIYRTGDHRRP